MSLYINCEHLKLYFLATSNWTSIASNFLVLKHLKENTMIVIPVYAFLLTFISLFYIFNFLDICWANE